MAAGPRAKVVIFLMTYFICLIKPFILAKNLQNKLNQKIPAVTVRDKTGRKTVTTLMQGREKQNSGRR